MDVQALTILESGQDLHWDYDGEADVLYISGASPAVGIDISEGVVVRYDESQSEVVGLSIVGLREKMLRELSD